MEGSVAGTGFVVVSVAGVASEVQEALAADPRVAVVEPNHVRRITAVPDDPSYLASQSAYLGAVRLPEAWELSTGSDDLTLAVVDSGVWAGHPELAGRVLPGRDIVDGDNDPDDELGHGTRVATIAAARADDGAGMAGVAWRGKILPVRVVDRDGNASDADIAAGIVWAADHGADVISLALGGNPRSQTVEEAVRYAISSDVVIVASAGNTHRSAPFYPAAIDGVVAVAATDRNGYLAPFSNYGPWVDLAAPGIGVLAGGREGYQVVDGTSSAAPIVAGVALLARARFPEAGAAEIVGRLQDGARDVGPLGRDDVYGYGMVDALGALGGPRPERRLDPATRVHEPDNTPERGSELRVTAAAMLAPEGDVDWFTTSVGSDGWVKVTLIPAPAATGAQVGSIVDLYGPDLKLLRSALAWPRNPAKITVRLAPGRYHVRVRSQAVAAQVPYTVSLAPTAPPADALAFHNMPGWALGSPGLAVTTGDVTGDGVADIVATTGSGGNPDTDHDLVLIPARGGNFAPQLHLPTGGTGSEPDDMGVAVGDVDGDGRGDVVVATAAGVEVRYQRGGGLSAATLIPVPGAHQVAVGDVDGDGRRDIAVNTIHAGLRLLVNRGGAFEVSSFAAGRVAEIEMADMDSDSRQDVVALECPAACTDVTVYRWRPGGLLARAVTHVEALGTTTANVTCALGVGEVTGDGWRDAFAACANTRLVHVLAGRSNGELEAAVVVPVKNEVAGLDSADVDGDGRGDIVALYGYPTVHVGLFRQQADGTLASEHTVSFGWANGYPTTKGLSLGDMNGDGLLDLVATLNDWWSGSLQVRLQDPGYPTPGPQLWVRDTTPADGSTGVHPDVQPVVRFVPPLSTSTVSNASFQLVDTNTGAVVPADSRHDPTVNAVALHPRARLTPGRTYAVRISDLADTAASSAECCFRFAVGDGLALQPSPSNPHGSGYWMVAADGAIYSFGDAQYHGRATTEQDTPAVDLEPTPTGRGYWVIDARGVVTTYGDATWHGNADTTGEDITSISATPTGHGYWIFTTTGTVYAFGDATHHGDMAGIPLNGPVLDSIITPSGQGYYMVASDGGIFSFGDAHFHGSMGGHPLNAPVQSLVPDPDGIGYWLVASDGGVFSFEATFRGSMGSVSLNRPVTGMVPFGNGYLMVAEDGGIFNFSDGPFHGSLGANPPAHSIVAVAPLPN